LGDVFEGIAAIDSWTGNLGAQFDLGLADRVERLRGAFVTPNFFDLLGARAYIGRLFDERLSEASTTPIVISYRLWQRLGEASGLIGKPMTLAVGRPRQPRTFQVAAVLPPDFRFTYPEETEAWVALPWSEMRAMNPRSLTREPIFSAVARLKN